MNRIYILCGLLAISASVWGQTPSSSPSSSCIQDYDCGNVPYTICKDGVNDCAYTVAGLGVDAANNQIYFAQICRDTRSNSNILGTNVTIKKVGPEGGIPSVVQTRIQIPAAANPGRIFDVIGNYLYISIQARAPGQLLTALDLTTFREYPLSTGGNFQNIIEFDQTNSRTYVVNVVFPSGGYNSYYYEIRRFDGILGYASPSVANYLLYNVSNPSYFTSLSVQGSFLYFTVITPNADYTSYTSVVYRISTDCIQCTSATALFSLANTQIRDIVVTGDKIFYSTANGVYSSDLDGGNSEHIYWSDKTQGIRALGNKIYWNANNIFSNPIYGLQVKQINEYSGTCKCQSGFTGSQCTTCSGQVQWNQGVPACVALLADGNPVTCSFDYECRYNPYSWCIGSCQCRPGLTGTGCTQCTNSSQTLTWVDGLPTCA